MMKTTEISDQEVRSQLMIQKKEIKSWKGMRISALEIPPHIKKTRMPQLINLMAQNKLLILMSIGTFDFVFTVSLAISIFQSYVNTPHLILLL